MRNFTSPQFNVVKRSLSRYEKASLLTTDGRALILPGAPGFDGSGEIDELVEAGYDEDRIVAVEHDSDTASAIYESCFDRIGGIHHIDVHEFMARATKLYSYIHLDYMGHITRKEFTGMQSWIGIVDATARIRVSSAMFRKRETTVSYEHLQHRALLSRLCEIAGSVEVDNPRWGELARDFEATADDTTQLLAMIALFNFSFGTTTAAWTDEVTKEPALPVLEGTHRIAKLSRYNYCDDKRSMMYTMWLDLVPLSVYSSSESDAVPNVLRELTRVLNLLNTPAIPFAPEHYVTERIRHP